VTESPRWIPLDCHAHTTLSDGALSVEELVAQVKSRGVRPSVSDHLSTDVSGAVKTIWAVREYIETLDRHDVLRGAEFCWHDPLWRKVPEDLRPRFTHCIGSLHAVFLTDGSRAHVFARALPDGLTAGDYMDYHVGNAEMLAQAMPVDILAHPTLIALPLRGMPTDELWTEEREERLVEALYHGGIAFEVSNRYRPHERLVRRALDRGVRLSLGSDGHTSEQVGDIAYPLAFVRQLGARDEDLYDPAVHGSKHLALPD
jgi:histidinol phosphatase-like PHP family hydrolase